MPFCFRKDKNAKKKQAAKNAKLHMYFAICC